MLLNNPDCPPEEGVLACPIRGGRGAVEVRVEIAVFRLLTSQVHQHSL